MTLRTRAAGRIRILADRVRTVVFDRYARRTIGQGFGGGLIATAIMTAYRIPIFRALPPTAEFWALYVGEERADRYLLEGLLLHALYGGVAGAVFAPPYEYLRSKTTRSAERLGVLAGIGYGLLLSAFGKRVVFEYVLHDDLDPDGALVFHVGHAMYGVTLGTWISTREAFGEVYD